MYSESQREKEIEFIVYKLCSLLENLVNQIDIHLKNGISNERIIVSYSRKVKYTKKRNC